MGQNLPLTTLVTDLAILGAAMDAIVRVVAHDETLRDEQNAKLEAIDRVRKDANNLRQQRRRARLKAEALARTQNFLADVRLHDVTEPSPYTSSSSPLGLTTSKEEDRGREKKPFRPDQRHYALVKDTHTPDFVEDAVDQLVAWVQRERDLHEDPAWICDEFGVTEADIVEARAQQTAYRIAMAEYPKLLAAWKAQYG